MVERTNSKMEETNSESIFEEFDLQSHLLEVEKIEERTNFSCSFGCFGTVGSYGSNGGCANTSGSFGTFGCLCSST